MARDSIVFTWGSRQQAVTVADAEDLQSYIGAERSLAASELHSRIANALRNDDDTSTVALEDERLGNEMVGVLLTMFEAIEDRHALTDGQFALRVWAEGY